MHFEKIDVLLLEPNAVIRRAIRDALASLGTRNITAIATAAEFEYSLNRQTPDLVICDVLSANRAAVEIIRVLRYGFLGENPFASVLTTAENPTLSLVKEVINSGTDSVMSKPLSIKSVIDRVHAITFLRKPFVVTKDYIGPARRLAGREDKNHPLIDVPNTLRDKVEGVYDHKAARKQIHEARLVVDEQKTSQDARVIDSIVRQIVAAAKSKIRVYPLTKQLDELRVAAEDISRRLAGYGEREVPALCGSLLRVVEKLRSESRSPDRADMELLQNLSQAIQLAYKPDSRITKYAENISVAIKRSKRYQMA